MLLVCIFAMGTYLNLFDVNVQRNKKTAGLSQSTSHMVTTFKKSSMKKKLRDLFDIIDIK